MPGRQAKIITPTMLRRMLTAVANRQTTKRDRAMILLSIKAGLRACEIAGLDWSMVLDAQGRVSVHHPRSRRHREEARGTADSHASQPKAGAGGAQVGVGAAGAGGSLGARRRHAAEKHRQLVHRLIRQLGA